MSYQDDNYRDAPPPLPTDRQDRDERYPEDRERYRPPQEQKGCSKGCMWGLAGCGCLTFVAIIVGGIVAWKVIDFASKSMSTDPAVVKATTAEIADMNVPADLEPKFKMNMVFAKLVLYQSADGTSQLTMMQFDKTFLGGNQQQQQQIEDEIKKGMREQKGANNRDFDITETKEQEIKVRGGVAKFQFIAAKERSSGKEYQLIQGNFQGKGGPVQLELHLPKEKYKEEDVVKFLEEIK